MAYTYVFVNQDVNKFVLLLWNLVYPYEQVDDWDKFSETSLQEKENFYNHLNMKDISDTGYKHVTRVCKDFKIKHLGEYHDWYIQSDTLLVGGAFNNFRNICLEISELDLAILFFSPRISMASTLRKV